MLRNSWVWGPFSFDGSSRLPPPYATLGTKAAAAYGGLHDLTPDASLEVDIVLGKDGFALSGIVRDAQGAPVQGARVEAAKMSENEGEVFFVTTDAAGHYGVVYGQRTKTDAIRAALENCEILERRCAIYAVDNNLVQADRVSGSERGRSESIR